jgi:hypothetical protein
MGVGPDAGATACGTTGDAGVEPPPPPEQPARLALKAATPARKASERFLMPKLYRKCLAKCNALRYHPPMKDAQLTVRLPAALKDKIQERALAESNRGARVTMADIVARTMAQAAKRWAK